jgi:hypothetical protein
MSLQSSIQSSRAFRAKIGGTQLCIVNAQDLRTCQHVTHDPHRVSGASCAAHPQETLEGNSEFSSTNYYPLMCVTQCVHRKTGRDPTPERPRVRRTAASTADGGTPAAVCPQLCTQMAALLSPSLALRILKKLLKGSQIFAQRVLILADLDASTES